VEAAAQVPENFMLVLRFFKNEVNRALIPRKGFTVVSFYRRKGFAADAPEEPMTD
jgi:hypothetical protein